VICIFYYINSFNTTINWLLRPNIAIAWNWSLCFLCHMFPIIWLSSLLVMIIPDDVYSRNVICPLILIFTFFIAINHCYIYGIDNSKSFTTCISCELCCYTVNPPHVLCLSQLWCWPNIDSCLVVSWQNLFAKFHVRSISFLYLSPFSPFV
jgi:hypothetical protein